MDAGRATPVPRGYCGRAPGLQRRGRRQGEGRSSPPRRMLELPQVLSPTQIGLRCIGGSRSAEVQAACAAGSRLVPAADVHRHGLSWLMQQLPVGGEVLLSIDCDSLDPSVAPGTCWPQPGGLSFRDVAAIIDHLGRKVPDRRRRCGRAPSVARRERSDGVDGVPPARARYRPPRSPTTRPGSRMTPIATMRSNATWRSGSGCSPSGNGGTLVRDQREGRSS
jgi:hypothetical protein